MQLKSLTYTSQAQPGLSDRDVGDIHVASRHLNALDGISGVLIFDGVSFLQIIEGVADAIDSLAERLRRDGRHVDFMVRDERVIDNRSFSDWSMNLVRVTAGYEDAWTQIAPVLPEGTTREVRELLYRMTDQLSAER